MPISNRAVADGSIVSPLAKLPLPICLAATDATNSSPFKGTGNGLGLITANRTVTWAGERVGCGERGGFIEVEDGDLPWSDRFLDWHLALLHHAAVFDQFVAVELEHRPVGTLDLALQTNPVLGKAEVGYLEIEPGDRRFFDRDRVRCRFAADCRCREREHR